MKIDMMKKERNLKRTAGNELDDNKVKKLKENDTGNAKLSKSELFKPPTVEELNQLRETELLFNSNLFRLQTEELIKEVTLKKKRKNTINAWIENFEKFLNTLPEHTDNRLSDFDATLSLSTLKNKGQLDDVLKKIAKYNPLRLKTDQDCPVKLIKPNNIQVSGFYSLNAAIGPKSTVTINLEIPKNYFQSKDYLNARYLVKRSLYLSYIVTYLETSELISKVSYEFLQGNELLPIALVTPKNLQNVLFEIVLSPEEETFKLGRFEAEKSNLRNSYTTAALSISLSENSQTPFYNSTILSDMTRKANDQFRLNVQPLKGACEALALLQVWLRQRELDLAAYLFLDLMAYLVNTSRINRHMSSYQVLRNVWGHVAQSSWEDNSNNTVFMDCTGHFNVAFNLDRSIYRRIKMEAAQALSHLDDATMNSFQVIFMTPMPFHLQYDAVVNIYNDSELDNLYNELDNNKRADYLIYKRPLLVSHLQQGLENGLTDRVTCIVPCKSSNDVFVSFGLQLNVANMYKVVDKGPPAYDPQAANFRKFWDEKAELRRFKDGAISEAVFWPAKLIREKRKISKSIISYVLSNKFHLKTYNIVYDEVEAVLDTYNSPAVEEANLKSVAIFDELAKKLRDLQLPLNIASIQGISDVFSQSDPWPPTPTNFKTETKVTQEIRSKITSFRDVKLKIVPELVSPLEGIIQMVQHSKWPSDLEAMRRLRTAFYLQIAQQLQNDHKMTAFAAVDHLDVVHGGEVIRLELFHNKEIHLLDEKEAEARELHCVVLPRLRGLLNGVHGRHPSAGPTAALAQRWLRAQLLDESHIPSIVVNLLAAATYSSSYGCAPALPQLGFMRFLSLLGRHPWISQPLFVDFHDELTTEQRETIEVRFREQRESLPPLCVVTAADDKSRISSCGPCSPTLNHLTLLAAQALDIFEKHLYSQTLHSIVAGLFKPNLNGYNVLIHLQPFLNACRHRTLLAAPNSAAHIFDEDQPNNLPIVGFNPVELYLQDLRKHYDDFALFFHDSYGGNVIAVLWKPTVFQKQEFKVAQISGMKIVNDTLQVNLDAIVDDFYTLGEGIVKNIEIK